MSRLKNIRNKQVGDKIVVLYDPQNPGNIYLEEHEREFLFVAAIDIILAAAIYLVIRLSNI